MYYIPNENNDWIILVSNYNRKYFVLRISTNIQAI